MLPPSDHTNIVYSGREFRQAASLTPRVGMPRSVFTDSYEVLREELVRAREKAGLTQAELSARLGRPQPFISKVEHGVRRIDVIEFCAIARALQVEPSTLFSRVARRLPTKIEI